MAEARPVRTLEDLRRLRPQIMALAERCGALREELKPYVVAEVVPI